MGFYHILFRLLKSQAIPIAKSIYKAYQHHAKNSASYSQTSNLYT